MSTSPQRDLLFGILALQLDFISREQLVAAIRSWVTDYNVPLEEILRNQDAIDLPKRDLLVALVNEHIAQHSDDVIKSLASLSSIGDLQSTLRSLEDSQLNATLSHVASKPSLKQAGVGSTSETVERHHRFLVIRPHARGGLGEVSIARDTELNRDVAFKEIQPRYAADQESRNRFMVEAEITGGLEHPGIVPVYGLGQYADGRPYYAMRFIRGDSLEDAIDHFYKQASLFEKRRAGTQYSTIEFRKLLGRLIDVCHAIAYAHSRGVLHRDLKPGNIMLGKYGETLVVDWGLAKAAGKEMGATDISDEPELLPRSGSVSAPTVMGSAIGTPAFMSPEQAAGRIDELGPASDVYSLGATLYYLLTGSLPFERQDLAQLLGKVKRGEFDAPSSKMSTVPRQLEAICLLAMNLDPARRYRSPQALAEDIELYLADEPITAFTDPVLVRMRRWFKKHQVLSASAGATMVATFIGLCIFSVLLGGINRELASANDRERLARKNAESAQFTASRQAATLAINRGIDFGDIGEGDEALHWVVRAMELAPESDNSFHDMGRANVSLFSNEIHLLTAIFQHEQHQPVDAAFTPDGKGLLSIDGFVVRFWDVDNRKLKSTLELPNEQAAQESTRQIHGFQSPLKFIEISHDGKYCCAGTSTGRVFTWEISTGRLNGESINLGGSVGAMDFHPTSSILAVASNSGEIRILDIAEGAILEHSMSHGSEVRSLEFNPKGQSLISSGDNWILRNWDWKVGEQIGPNYLHDAPVMTSCWSPDGERILSGDVLRSLREWNVQTHEVDVLDVELSSFVVSAQYSSDGGQFALGLNNGQVGIWDRNSLRRIGQLLNHEKEVYWIQFRPGQNTQIASTGLREVRLWNIVTAPETSVELHDPFYVEGLSFVTVHPGKSVAAIGSMKGNARVVHIETGEVIGSPIAFGEPVSIIEFDEKTERMLIAGFRGKAQLYELQDNEWTRVFKPMQIGGSVMGGAFLANDEVACVTFEGSVEFRNSRQGDTSRPSLSIANSLRIATTQNSDRLLVGAAKGRFKMVDLASMEDVFPEVEVPGEVMQMHMSANGKFFAAGYADGRAIVWDAVTGKQLYGPLTHTDGVRNLKFTNDGEYFITGCVDGGTRLWHTKTGMQVGPVRWTHSRTLGSCDLLPEDSRVFSIDFTSPIKLYTWPVASSMEIENSQLRTYVESLTGARINENGGLRLLYTKDWEPYAK